MTEAIASPEPAEESSPLAVFRNTGFLRLWLSQVTTQIGGNMVLFGLTLIVSDTTGSSIAVRISRTRSARKLKQRIPSPSRMPAGP